MKIMENGTIRDMTTEEEAAFIDARQNQDEPIDEMEQANALTRYANSITGASDPDLISAAETLIEQRIKEEH